MGAPFLASFARSGAYMTLNQAAEFSSSGQTSRSQPQARFSVRTRRNEMQIATSIKALQSRRHPGILGFIRIDSL